MTSTFTWCKIRVNRARNKINFICCRTKRGVIQATKAITQQHGRDTAHGPRLSYCPQIESKWQRSGESRQKKACDATKRWVHVKRSPSLSPCAHLTRPAASWPDNVNIISLISVSSPSAPRHWTGWKRRAHPIPELELYKQIPQCQ